MRTIETDINAFLSHCIYEKNLSRKTLKAYEIDLTQFINFLKKSSFQNDFNALSKFEIRQYLQEISSFKPKTIKRKLASLKALFNFLEFEDKISTNPFRKLKLQIKEPKDLPSVMNLVEIENILKHAYAIKSEFDPESFSFAEAVRNIATIEMLFSTGMRVSELSNLKTENVNLISGLIKLTGKGNKERIIQICNKEALDSIRLYEHTFRDKINKSGGVFFINRINQKLSDQSIRFLVKNFAKKSGIIRSITPHTFRHSFATLLLEQDVDIKYIQQLLGHSSIMTTQIYTHVNAEKQRQVLLRHPRKNLSLNNVFIVP